MKKVLTGFLVYAFCSLALLGNGVVAEEPKAKKPQAMLLWQ
ncbi:hypothetical protein [Brevibacillus humidisoli]|nr:hypothetical protein [Brevibacillus humidisoli]